MPTTSELFVFAHVWRLPAPPAAVFAALADIGQCPVWWPQVRSIEFCGTDAALAEARSALPYTLRLVLTDELRDPATGRLRVGLSGDLQGWLELRVSAGEPGSVVNLRQECVVTVPRIVRAAPALGSVMRANHWWMMRGGRRGLIRYLAAATT